MCVTLSAPILYRSRKVLGLTKQSLDRTTWAAPELLFDKSKHLTDKTEKKQRCVHKTKLFYNKKQQL